jgi:pyruvate carboxylase
VALGLGDKFNEIKKAFAEVNDMFGDIVKVTPSSKVVGDMAQFMVANELSPEDVMRKGETLSFPESVEGFFAGEIGQPEGGFPQELQRIILKGRKPLTDRAGKHLPPVDFEAGMAAFREKFGMNASFTDFLSYKLYPKVFEEYWKFREMYGDVSVVPTPIFFYGMKPGEDTTIEIARGKTLLIRLLSITPADDKGNRTVFFKLNGQTRAIEILDKSVKVEHKENRKADKSDERQIAAPLQGLLSKLMMAQGAQVKKAQPLFVIEAMKMETTISAPFDGVVKELALGEGSLVNTGDLVVVMG